MFRIKLFRAPMFQIKMYRAPNVYNQDVPSPKCVESRCTEPQMFRIKMLLAPLFLIKINRAPNGSNQDVPSPNAQSQDVLFQDVPSPNAQSQGVLFQDVPSPNVPSKKKFYAPSYKGRGPMFWANMYNSGDSEQDQTALHSLPNKCTAR